MLELEKLKRWVDKYYVGEAKDTHFEYYSFAKTLPVELIFEEDAAKPEIRRTHGSFTYGFLAGRESDTPAPKTSFVARDLGNRPSKWSKQFADRCINKTFAGIWFFIDQPPVLHGRKTISVWKDLLALLSPAQIRVLYEASQNFAGISCHKEGLFIALGYMIPSADTGEKEVHWDLLYAAFRLFPVVRENGRFYFREELPVEWCTTQNAAYGRVFGRGKLPTALTEAKLLIIGTGAIGSSLFTTLVRGGCKHIAIADGDSAEAGNICRANFRMTDINRSKTHQLKTEGHTISPYVQIETMEKIEPTVPANPAWNALQRQLSAYDFVFDCSTDKYLSYMLDQMLLRGMVINLSVTDEAKEMVVVTGHGNIHRRKSDIYDRISPGNREPFFVATGCWSPTFKAGYSDMNILLHYAICEMSARLDAGVSIESFIISKTRSAHLEYNLSYAV